MAKKDKDLKPAYKLFVDLHTDFSALIEVTCYLNISLLVFLPFVSL